jgi:hypothetical protein
MIKIKLTLAVAIVLSSAVAAAAQSYYDSYSISPKSTGAPPLFSENPGATGGGSIGYNDDLRKDAW